MIKYSANLGFLWSELALPEAIRAARKFGFQAVECHWPYEYDPAEIRQVLDETGLAMLSLNTLRGDVVNGENGLSAVSGREVEARQYIDQACEYAQAIGCGKIHVMAGRTDKGVHAEQTFQDNLKYACDRADEFDQVVLIEPLNNRDAPSYHLSTLDAAIQTVEAVGKNNLKVMFDCYHIQIMQGDLIRRLQESMPYIGHIQMAGVPDRCEPDQGEVNYPEVFKAIESMGYTGFIGAEYRPRTTTEEGLAWLTV